MVLEKGCARDPQKWPHPESGNTAVPGLRRHTPASTGASPGECLYRDSKRPSGVRRMSLPGRYGVMACVAMLAAWSDAAGAGGRGEIADARGLWESRDVDDYRMTVQLGGAWLSGAAVIQVRD